MLTPLDIKKHEFTRKWRGYDEDEVKALLESVARDFEEMVRHNTLLSERLKVAEERINHYRLMEKTLQDAVVTIQTTLEEKRRIADQEAHLIIQDARRRADEELAQSRKHLTDMQGEMYQLEHQKRQFFARYRNLLKTQMELLEALAGAEERGQHLG